MISNVEPKNITMINDVADVEKLAPFIDELSEELSLDPVIVFNLNLAVEEAVSNVMMYAYDAPGNTFTLSASCEDGMLTFVIIDSGKPFDPTTEIKEVDTTLSLEERPIGGLGMFLIKNIMDEVSYKRDGNHNILTLSKKIG